MKLSTVRSVWLASLLAVAVPYTVLAFGMEWRTTAGRIGPGFFPRLIGLALVGALLLALARSARDRKEASEGTGGGGTYVRTLLLMIGATVLFLVLLEPLGALLAGVGYMLATLTALNRGRWIVNVPVAVILPTALYLLFQTWLGAGLPLGVLAVF